MKTINCHKCNQNGKTSEVCRCDEGSNSALAAGSIAMLQIADELDNAQRIGAETDEPEGTRYVQISDTLLKEITRKIRFYVVKQ